jgi:glutathione synthase/RimK-type ligase-like ATP-grasp enzyme
MKKRVLALLRAEQFSPHSVEKDKAIMMAVVERLQRRGHEVEVRHETEVVAHQGDEPFQVVLTMGRLPSTLEALKRLDAQVINSPKGVENCARGILARLMAANHIPAAPDKGEQGYWLKRADTTAQQKGDVVFAQDEQELEMNIKEFRQRGINAYTVSAHVEGDVVKFYGVRGTRFFRYYYPTDDGQTKFGDESRNGQAHHYAFLPSELQQMSEKLAAAVGIEVYGGDCIVRSNGTYCIIDFNDWPSFSRCREEAAEAIASLVF